MENDAIKILERIDECNIGKFNDNGCTALIWSCCNKMENVALKILERMDECNIGQGNTALILACLNNMENVIIEIVKYTEDIDIDIKKNVLDSYINYKLNK